MECGHCGAAVGDGDRYCAACGQPLDGRPEVDVAVVATPPVRPGARWRAWVGAGIVAAVVAGVIVALSASSEPATVEPTPVAAPPAPTATATPEAAPTTAATARPTATAQPLTSLSDAGLAPGRLVLAGRGVVTVYDIETGERWNPPVGSRADNSAIHLVGSTMVTTALSGVGDEVRFIDLDTGDVGVWGDPRNLLDRWPVIVKGATDDALVAQLVYVQRGSFDWVTIDRRTLETVPIELPLAERSVDIATLADGLVVAAGSRIVRLDDAGPVAIGSGDIVAWSSGAVLLVECDPALSCVSRSVTIDGTVVAEGPVLELPTGVNSATPVLSPDGTMVAVWNVADRTVEIIDVATGDVRQLETGSQTPGRPIWSPDSRHVVVTDRGRLIVLDVASGGRAVLDLDQTYNQVAIIPPGPIDPGGPSA